MGGKSDGAAAEVGGLANTMSAAGRGLVEAGSTNRAANAMSAAGAGICDDPCEGGGGGGCEGEGECERGCDASAAMRARVSSGGCPLDAWS